MKCKSAFSTSIAVVLFLQTLCFQNNNLYLNSDFTISAVAEDQTGSYEYRYRTKSYTTSNKELSEPYIYVDKKTEYSSYGDWSSWTQGIVYSSDTREVVSEERKTIASYEMVSYRTRGNPDTIDDGCYVVNTGALNVRSGPGTGYDSLGTSENGSPFKVDQISGDWGHAISIHTNNGVKDGWVNLKYCKQSGDRYVQYRNYSVNNNYSGYDLNSNWGEHTEGSPWTWDPSTLNSARKIAPWAFATDLVVNDGSYNADGYNMTDQTGYVVNDGYGSYIWFINKINYNSETWYRYRDRTETTTYTYYKWTEWSEWSTTPPLDSDDIEVQKRQVSVSTEPQTSTTTSSSTVSTSNTIVSSTSTTSVANADQFTYGRDNYNFLNKKEYFNSKYNISSELKEQLSKKSDNLGWDSINALIESNWDGSCYGMSSVEILSKSGMLDTSLLDSNASSLYTVSAPINNVNSESYINYYHVLQRCSIIQKKINNYIKKTNKARIDDIVSMVSSVKDSGIPVLICFNYSKSASKKLDGGHAIVGYGIEYGTWTYSGKYNCRILISDPNSSEFKDEMCLYINTDTYEWQIPYYQEKYYSCTNTNQNTKDKPWAQILLATNDINLIDTFGLLRKSTINDTEDKDSIISINTASNNFGVSYYDNKTGTINDTDFELDFYSDAFGLNDNNTVNACLPQADVPYEYYEKTTRSFCTVVEYTNSKFEVDVSNGNYAIYDPDHAVEFVGKNSDYTLTMTSNSGYHPTDWYKISVDGECSDNSQLEISENGYILTSDSLSDGVFIQASNRTEEANLGIVTNYSSIYIYEIDKTHIGIKLDTNGDGKYETDFHPKYAGDANQDGAVSIADVILLQKYLLNDANVNKKQYISMDMNLDGYVNAIDLVLAKRYVLENL